MPTSSNPLTFGSGFEISGKTRNESAAPFVLPRDEGICGAQPQVKCCVVLRGDSALFYEVFVEHHHLWKPNKSQTPRMTPMDALNKRAFVLSWKRRHLNPLTDERGGQLYCFEMHYSMEIRIKKHSADHALERLTHNADTVMERVIWRGIATGA